MFSNVGQIHHFRVVTPLWNANYAFEAQGRIIRQLAEAPDGARYLSLAMHVTRTGGGYLNTPVSHVLAFGCEVSYADVFIYADNMNLTEKSSFDPIGISCRICERMGCTSRAIPPLKRRLAINYDKRLQIPYELE